MDKVSIDVESALNDIAWLFKRFRGLETLVPYLEDFKRLDEAKSIKQEIITKLNEEAQELRDEIKRQSLELSNLKKTKDVRQADLDSEASSFRKKVNQDLADYKDKVMSEIDEVAIQRRKDLSDLDSVLHQKKKEIAEVNNELLVSQKKLQDFKSRLASLKLD